MAEESVLESLSPELQRLILLQLDSFEALHALILASPRFYQLFKINRETAFSAIARRRFHRAAVWEALAIERLAQVEKPPYSRKNVLRFFDFTPSDLDPPPNTILPLSVSTGLCKTDKVIRLFTTDYAENSLPILAQLQSSDTASIRTQYRMNIYDPPSFHLSDLELTRLRRAFFRFETYRILFARCPLGLEHDDHNVQRSHPVAPVFEQGKKFFRSSPAYHIAEIACVRDYLYRRLRGIFDQVEDETVRALQAECPNPMNTESALDWDAKNGWRYHDYFFEHDDHLDDHLFTYNGKFNQHLHIEHLLSLGLPYILKILEATGDERRDLLLHGKRDWYTHHETRFLTAALAHYSFSRPSKRWRRRQTDPTPSSHQAIKANAPPGWLWAHGEHGYSDLAVDTYKGLRDWRYVFWDLDRLQNAGILDRDPRDLMELKFDENLAGCGPSVQERWIGPSKSIPKIRDAAEDGEKFRMRKNKKSSKRRETWVMSRHSFWYSDGYGTLEPSC